MANQLNNQFVIKSDDLMKMRLALAEQCHVYSKKRNKAAKRGDKSDLIMQQGKLSDCERLWSYLGDVMKQVNSDNNDKLTLCISDKHR